MKRTAFVVGSLGLVLVGFVACGINPQPLPPEDANGAPDRNQDAGNAAGEDDGSSGPNEGSSDAGSPPVGFDAGANEGDASDLDADVGDADAGDADTSDAEVDGGSDAATDDAG